MAEAEKMYRDVNLYAKMRRAVMLESISERGVANQFGINRKPGRKVILQSVPLPKKVHANLHCIEGKSACP